MRTYFELDEAEEFGAAKELLIRRCVAWAGEHGMRVDPPVLSALLDSRHLSTDGRLAYWGPDQVRRALLEWIPRQVVADPGTLRDAPQSLLTLLRYLAVSALRDPRGAEMTALEAAVADAAKEYPAALADPARWGIGKFWALAARENGVDLTDSRAVARFQRDIEAGRARYDGELLNRLMAVRLGEPEFGQERAYSQLPVVLPPEQELAAAAADGPVVRKLAALARWVGRDGRSLTAAGNLRLQDARELAELLETGEHRFEVRSAAQMPQLNLLLAWAKKARLVRVNKGRLAQVAKAAPLLRDPQRLWQRAFETCFELGEVVCRPVASAEGPSMLVGVFDDVLADVLNTIYSMPHPVPVARLQETVWLTCQGYFWLGVADAATLQDLWRQQVDRDLVRAFEMLAELGAVELSHGVADEMFSADLGDDFEEECPLPPEACARLVKQLAEPGLLVRLTPLGVRAMRERMLAQGRDVPLVGELVDAQPAELLGVLCQHYTRETAEAETEGWLTAHGGDVEPLLQAVRECPFRTRAAAMLGALVEAVALNLSELRDDPALGPIVVMALLDDGDLQPEDLTDRERLLMLTEGLLTLLELEGPEGVREHVADMAGRDAPEMMKAALNSGHPATAAVEELRTLVAERMPSRGHVLRMVADQASRPGGRPGGHGRKRKR